MHLDVVRRSAAQSPGAHAIVPAFFNTSRPVAKLPIFEDSGKMSKTVKYRKNMKIFQKCQKTTKIPAKKVQKFEKG